MQQATNSGFWFVTRRQLFRAWSQEASGAGRYGLAALVVPPILYFALGAGNWGPIGPVVVGALLLTLAWRAWTRFVPDEAAFDAELGEYVRRFGAPARLILRPGLGKAPPPAEDDVHDHGVAGILVVDEDLLVDLLVLNNVHAGLGCAVVSKGGYPKHVVEKLRPHARTAPVYLLRGSATSFDTMVRALERLFPGRAGAVTRDLGVAGGRGWIPGHPGLSRDKEVAPDSLRMATLSNLLVRAVQVGGSLAEAHRSVARSSRSSSWGDSNGWG